MPVAGRVSDDRSSVLDQHGAGDQNAGKAVEPFRVGRRYVSEMKQAQRVDAQGARAAGRMALAGLFPVDLDQVRGFGPGSFRFEVSAVDRGDPVVLDAHLRGFFDQGILYQKRIIKTRIDFHDGNPLQRVENARLKLFAQDALFVDQHLPWAVRDGQRVFGSLGRGCRSRCGQPENKKRLE